jgi:hypothetical protein
MPDALAAVTEPSFANAGFRPERFERGAGLDELVAVERDGIALALRDHHRTYLVLETPAFCAFSALFWLATANSSCCARLMPYLLRDVLRRGAHVVLVVDVPQAVDDHRVDELGVAHAEAVARAEQHVRRRAHVLLAAGDDDVGVAAAHRLRGEHHRLQSGPAHDVDRHGGHFLGIPDLMSVCRADSGRCPRPAPGPG